ncbi:MAG: hypothetical protein RBR59_02295 [Sulfurimonadaceae bacterium]|nr:hypothetical protein [Sulfurimonadaceae bacterium]
MKKFNLFKEIIVVDKAELLQAINSQKQFAIDIFGSITYEPFSSESIYIYQGKHMPKPTSALQTQTISLLESHFGKNYQIVEDGMRILIKAFGNWQEIIGFNIQNASYDDTTADGISEFSEEDLEEIGWYATEFHIDYRTLVEVLEQKSTGTLLCIEQEEPYQFSGLGFIENAIQAKDILFELAQTKIKEILTNDTSYSEEKLTKEEREATEFFQLLSK